MLPTPEEFEEWLAHEEQYQPRQLLLYHALFCDDRAGGGNSTQHDITAGEESFFCIWSESTYRHCWKRYCESNGLEYIPPYNLRHTFVSMAKTLPEGTVKELVGHSRQMDTYGTYAHLIKGEKQQLAEQLGDVLSKVLTEQKD